MTKLQDVLDRHERENFKTGLYQSYARAIGTDVMIWSDLERSGYEGASKILATFREAVRAELQLVPVVKHDDCDKCLFVGKLTMDGSAIMDLSAVAVSFDRHSIDGLSTDSFASEQLAVLIRQADELEELGVQFETSF